MKILRVRLVSGIHSAQEDDTKEVGRYVLHLYPGGRGALGLVDNVFATSCAQAFFTPRARLINRQVPGPAGYLLIMHLAKNFRSHY